MVIPALLATFFVVGDRVRWDVVVIGRGWLLLHVLPFALAATARPTDAATQR